MEDSSQNLEIHEAADRIYPLMANYSFDAQEEIIRDLLRVIYTRKLDSKKYHKEHLDIATEQSEKMKEKYPFIFIKQDEKL
jgi:hypothetical protein